MPTKIEWANETINPITGCNPVSESCQNCYAANIAKRFWGNRKFGDILFQPERLSQFLKWENKPKRIFINSMSDLFHERVKDKWIGMIIGHIAKAHWNTFMVLTKRPDRALEFCHAIAHYPKGDESQMPIAGLPPNLYFGVTAENQKRADERIPILLQIPAAVRFISVEPMLEKINLEMALEDFQPLNPDLTKKPAPINLIICGAETGPGARPMKPEWAIDLYNQCKAANVPFFFKKESKGLPVPDYIKVREFPNTATDTNNHTSTDPPCNRHRRRKKI